MYHNAGPGPLRAHKEGSLGTIESGMLRSYRDGSLGMVGPGPLQAHKEGSLGCGCGSVGEYFSTNGLGEYFSTNGLGEYFATNGIGEYFSTNGLGAMTEDQKKYLMYGVGGVAVLFAGMLLLKKKK